MKRKPSFQENHLFFVSLCLIFVFGVYGLIKNPQKKSASENRNLTQFQHFTIKSFIDGSFQENFENALSDQFALSEKIRTNYGEFMSKIPTFGLEKAVCENKYLELFSNSSQKRATFNCEDYIVRSPRKIQGSVYDHIKKYNRMNAENDVYYYIIKSYMTYDFEKDENIGDYVSLLSKNLTGQYKISSLAMDGYNDHKKFFYKTDHHWNYVGSYQGFLDIADMLGIKDPSKPIGTFTSQEYSFGSHARTVRNYNFEERFTIYLFNIPEHDTTINRKPDKYNHFDEFINHEYKYDRNMNFYGYVYGNDFGEVVFDFHQPEKENLLIISNSYSNAVNELIAQYFNKTYVVDLRYYENSLKEAFKYSEYIKTNHISKTLVIADSGFLTEKDLNQGLEL